MTDFNIKNIIIFIITLLACSCSTDTVYHKYQPINKNGWNRNDTISFIMPDSMKNGVYNAEIGIRHTESYKYMDLWLSAVFPQSNKADTFHVFLANDRGNWNSSGSTGGFFQISTESLKFNYIPSEDSVIRIYHIMKDNPLLEITDIGLKITKE